MPVLVFAGYIRQYIADIIHVLLHWNVSWEYTYFAESGSALNCQVKLLLLLLFADAEKVLSDPS